MKTISDRSIDFCLTDPPYGTTACKWDSIIPFDQMWSELDRIMNGPIAITASQPFTSALVMSNAHDFRHEWIWQKNCGSNFANLKSNPFKEHESVIVFSQKTPRFFPVMQQRSEGGRSMVRSCKYEGQAGGEFIGGKLKSDKAKRDPELRHPSSIQKFSRQVGLHPTQKPVPLLEYLIKTYTLEGDTVLDFTMGSGSTGVACKNLNRKFIGIEKDEKYFKIACERLGYKP